MRKRLIKNDNGGYEWKELETSSFNKVHPQGEDLSISKYISKYGGIQSHADGKVYTTERSYKDHLKANNLVIKDW